MFCLSDEVVSEEAMQKVKSVCASVTVVHLPLIPRLIRLALNIFGKLPMQVAYFSDKQALKQFRQLDSKLKPGCVMVQLARMAEFGKVSRSAVKLIDYQDAFSKGLERRKAHDPIWMRGLLEMEYRRLRAYETQILSDFTLATIISEQDAALIEHSDKSRLHILPNGVNTDYYKPEPRAKTIDLLFTGNMNYEPNVNCVQYVVKEVLPLLRDEYPHIQFVAAGKDPASELRRIQSRNLQLTGWVDDLRKYYQQARLFVAPMQIGIGMQNKILEAMSMGLPVITSSLANNAIGAEHGKEVWIANTPEKTAEAISYLMNNTDLAIRIGQNARKLMQERYSWEKQNQILNRLISGRKEQTHSEKLHQEQKKDS
ncbi:MAG: glycosyltransferase [Bacteroidia bacterium]